MFTLLIETSGANGVPSAHIETSLREGDEILWNDGKLEFFRRLTEDELPLYRRLRRTMLTQLTVGTPDGRKEALALQISRDIDACAAMIVHYHEVLPELLTWRWSVLGLLERLPQRQRFRACSRP